MNIKTLYFMNPILGGYIINFRLIQRYSVTPLRITAFVIKSPFVVPGTTLSNTDFDYASLL
jgi:hypothetical protein